MQHPHTEISALYIFYKLSYVNVKPKQKKVSDVDLMQVIGHSRLDGFVGEKNDDMGWCRQRSAFLQKDVVLAFRLAGGRFRVYIERMPEEVSWRIMTDKRSGVERNEKYFSK